MSRHSTFKEQPVQGVDEFYGRTFPFQNLKCFQWFRSLSGAKCTKVSFHDFLLFNKPCIWYCMPSTKKTVSCILEQIWWIKYFIAVVLWLILNFGWMTKGFFTCGKMISRFCDSMIYGWIRYWADVNIGENEFSRDIIWLKYGQHMPINIWPYNICAEHNKENRIKYSI